MKQNINLKELSSIIKLARKNSLIGEYGYSLEKYQEAIDMIKQRQSEISHENQDLKQKWKMTEYNIKSEMLQIKDMLQTCLQLLHFDLSFTQNQFEGNNHIKENKKNIEKEIFDILSKDKILYEKEKTYNNINYKTLNMNIKNNNSTIKRKSLNLSNTKLNKQKSKSSNLSNNFVYDNKKNKNNKNYFSSANKYNIVSNINIKNDKNLKKSKSLIENNEKKMFNPVEEFYGYELNDNDINNINNINDESMINGQQKKVKIISIDLDKELNNKNIKKYKKI